MPLTTASDFYSLGLVLLECFTRTAAFPGDAVVSAMAQTVADPPIPASVPELWRAVLARMKRQDPAERPTASQVTEKVRQVLRALPE